MVDDICIHPFSYVSQKSHDFEEKYHDFQLSIVKIMIFLFPSLPPNIVFPWQIASP